MKCPCKSKKSYQDCCKQYHDGKIASSPEKIMRSRYSAYVLHKDDYLKMTWLPEKCPMEIQTLHSGIQWIHLVVNGITFDKCNANQGQVTYTAFYTDGKDYFSLHEKSNFLKEKGAWFYVDGDTETNVVKINRSSKCLCGSHKKFKRCCAK